MPKRKRVVFESRIPEFQERLRESILVNLRAASMVWLRAVKRRLSNSPARSGARYPLPSGNGFYTASAPGESPALVSGVLRASYSAQTNRFDFVSRVGSPLKYAFELERGNNNLEPRPVIEPAFKDAEREITKAMTTKVPYAS